MTTIVGIAYPSGLVMASDLLATSGTGRNTRRFKGTKIYHRNGLVVGYTGNSTERVHYVIGRRTRVLFSRHSIDTLIRRELIKFIDDVNVSMVEEPLGPYWNRFTFLQLIPRIDDLIAYYHLEALVGYCLRSFRVGYYPGFGDRFVHQGKVAVLSPVKRDYSDFFAGVKRVNGHQALELAISIVRDNNRRYPEFSSGLEVVQMTRDETKRVAYEPISR